MNVIKIRDRKGNEWFCTIPLPKVSLFACRVLLG